MHRKNCNYIFVFLMIMFVSCKNNIHEDYHTFKDGLWNTEEPITFKYHISDTTKKYNLSLKIRYRVDYEFQNLIVFLNGIDYFFNQCHSICFGVLPPHCFCVCLLFVSCRLFLLNTAFVILFPTLLILTRGRTFKSNV